MSQKSTVICPLEVVDRIINCSKELNILFDDFVSFSNDAFDCSEILILNSVKDKIQAALFQVNFVLDGSKIDMDQYLSAKKIESTRSLSGIVSEVANFRNAGFGYSVSDRAVSKTVKSQSFSKVSSSGNASSSSKSKVLFDMTNTLTEIDTFSGSSHEDDDVEFMGGSSSKCSGQKLSEMLTDVGTPVRLAKKAAKDIPMSPVGQRDFPISLSPDEIKQQRHQRYDSYQRILRSQQSLKSTQKPRVQHGPTYSDHILGESESDCA